ncbi:MAG: hypothetical protein FJ135_02830 [Deltaproteobacteria bacterium]|nr:hypothetical protein [Deltaproteobacteria bacterium]
MSEKPFRLYVYPRLQGAYGLTLSQKRVKSNPNGNGGSTGWRRLVRLYGMQLQAVAEDIFAILKQGGYRPGDLNRERRTPLELAEENGVRLGLLFMMVKPLTKGERITGISQGLKTMPVEEAYYWFSKCADPKFRGRAQRALRILLAGE